MATLDTLTVDDVAVLLRLDAATVLRELQAGRLEGTPDDVSGVEPYLGYLAHPCEITR